MATWFINFCAPFLPNDPTINTHRVLQSSILLAYTLLYAALHAYYSCGASPAQELQDPLENQIAALGNQEDKSSGTSQNSEENKEVSLKCDDMPNQSGFELKKSASTWHNSGSKDSDEVIQVTGVSLEEVKEYFPIVYGHFAVAMGISIMYSPYAEQTLSAMLYVLLTVPLLIANFSRRKYSTRFVWILMTLVLLFILTSGLLQVGQSNWNPLSFDCFSKEYVSLYS